MTTGIRFAASLRMPIAPFGSRTLTAIPWTPFVIRPRMICACSAAVPSPGVSKSTVTLNSFSAFRIPARANVQKSLGPLMTKARLSAPFWSDLVQLPAPQSTAASNINIKTSSESNTVRNVKIFNTSRGKRNSGNLGACCAGVVIDINGLDIAS